MPSSAVSWSSDLARTATRITALDTYFRAHVLNGTTLTCPRAGACRASTPHALYEGQLHHVGHHYDLENPHGPVRVMVMGQEYGRDIQHVGLTQRHAMIATDSAHGHRFHADRGLPGRNPHMRGTTTALRALLGSSLGADYDGEFLKIDGKVIHLFDAFALVNVLLCSAVIVDTGAKRGYRAAGRSTSTMQKNCQPHLRRTLEILEPTVIVVQGSMVRKSLERAVDRFRPLDSAIAQVSWGSSSAQALLLTHPAAHGPLNWGMNHEQTYVRTTLLPAAAAVRQRLISR